MHDTKNVLLIILATAAAFCAIGFSGATYFYSTSGDMCSLVSADPSGNSYQAGWAAAKKRLKDSGFFPMMDDMLEVKSLTGSVEAVNGNDLSVKIQPVEPLADPALDDRIVVIDQTTKIFSMKQKDQAQYQNEMSEYNKKIQEQTANPIHNPEQMEIFTPPDFYQKSISSISEILAGSRIIIKSDEDIKDSKEFKAAEIDILSDQSMPDTTAPTN